jgi:hypothetical protein
MCCDFMHVLWYKQQLLYADCWGTIESRSTSSYTVFVQEADDDSMIPFAWYRFVLVLWPRRNSLIAMSQYRIYASQRGIIPRYRQPTDISGAATQCCLMERAALPPPRSVPFPGTTRGLSIVSLLRKLTNLCHFSSMMLFQNQQISIGWYWAMTSC